MNDKVKPKAFQAYAKDAKATAATPRAAATKFFEKFPTKRKCNVLEGTIDGPFFCVSYGIGPNQKWPQSWKDVTKKTAATLPENEETSCPQP